MNQPHRALSTALLAGLCASLPGLASAAGASADTPHVKAALLAPFSAVQPGETIRLGLQQRIIPHWHTYWLNPGDSGLPTRIEWSLPAGASAGPIEWPAPRRFATGPVSNYGYADQVILLTPIQVPADLKPGSHFTVQASVDWLVCNEVCIPEQVVLSLDLPVVAAGVPRQPGSPLIEQTRAALPRPSPLPVTLEKGARSLRLGAEGPALAALKPVEGWFYAAEWGKTHHGAPQALKRDGDRLSLEIQAGEAPPAIGEKVEGVLSLTDADGRRHDFQIAPQAIAAAPGSLDEAPTAAAAAMPAGTAPGADDSLQLGAALLFALLGGLILNLMPCVFPVLSIKALSLLRHAGQAPGHTRLQGLAYTAGVLASFGVLAGVLLALKAGGSEVGWGFQFQSPVFVLAVAYLMFAVGLSLSGVLNFGASAAGLGGGLADKPGYAGSFFTGVLATVVATPCTAPFMGAALGFALSQPAPVLLAVFLSLGLGLALPYLLLSFWPALQRLLPRPGAWMERLKEALAFPMYGAAVWLVWVLAQQAGPNAIAIALGGMLAIAFAAWLAGHSHGARPLARHSGRGVAALSVLAALAGGYLGVSGETARAASAPQTAGKIWEPYSQARFDALRAEGKPVFINFTAAWCITCLANEKVALSAPQVEAAFRQAGITYLKGDWTNQDPEISAHLARFGRSGVPLYLLYPGGKGDVAPAVLPQLLTPATVLGAIDTATVRSLSLSLAKE
ncbi:MAG: protein-disulfide reductase DsbD family protein [Zoogloea sp.]|uniref:protein-disulfide reductase DsbD family protein n=1 Tax=Zoogloea sp. TaxID=49181 RepID=UPI00260DA653|nr:protein-disulfide reductase DsbD domain-containing protein [Zoogloea sp.]MDD2989971.1 protein-disulfide reductase DsbD family protein [Zoogloea sp.]